MWGGSLNFVRTAGSGYFKNLKEPPGFMKQLGQPHDGCLGGCLNSFEKLNTMVIYQN
jgi:hypothetical protein